MATRKASISLRRTKGRTTAKQDNVVQTLRREIIGGKFGKNTQLPPQSELAQRFGVSPITIGLALSRLAREGFVQARHRRGTFVVEKPPHLNNYALVFWNEPTGRHSPIGWSKYYASLTNAAIELQQTAQIRMLMFHGVNQHTDTDDRQRLEAYIRAHRLGGIIFVNFPADLEGTPILEEAGIPRVAFMSQHVYPQMRTVAFDDRMWMEKALDHLAAQRRKRIAMVMVGMYKESDQLISAEIAKRGMECPFHWRQIVSLYEPRAIRNCVHLLMYGAGAQRPDGLLITDDNFTEPAMAALIAAGVRVPDDVAVVTHCNFPWVSTPVLPVAQLGYDIRAALRTAIDLIDCQRRGEKVPELTRLPALFEEELAASAGVASPQPQGVLVEQRR
jgi:DNA-binding LacI/PurR family transcriptional regulator